MICKLFGHSLQTISVTDGSHYGIQAIKCKICRKVWNFRGEDEGWSKSGKEKQNVLPKDWEPYFGLRRDKRYKSLTPKELAPVYIQYALQQNALSTEQARELGKMAADEVIKLFTQK